MGDRTNCYLQLGGNVPRVVANAIVTDQFDNHEPSNSVMPSEDQDAPDAQSFWSVAYPEVNYGMLTAELGALLVEHKVPYNWYWDAGGDYGPGVSWWRPGMDKPASVNLTADGDEYVTIQQIRERAALEPGLSLSDFLGSLDIVPDLPPCRFIEDGSPIKVGPDPLPQTFTLIGTDPDGKPWSRAVEAIDAEYARKLAPQAVTVTAVVVGRCMLAA